MFYFYLIVSLSSVFLLLMRLNIPILAIYTYRYGYSKAGIGHLPLYIFRTIDATLLCVLQTFIHMSFALLIGFWSVALSPLFIFYEVTPNSFSCLLLLSC